MVRSWCAMKSALAEQLFNPVIRRNKFHSKPVSNLVQLYVTDFIKPEARYNLALTEIFPAIELKLGFNTFDINLQNAFSNHEGIHTLNLKREVINRPISLFTFYYCLSTKKITPPQSFPLSPNLYTPQYNTNKQNLPLR